MDANALREMTVDELQERHRQFKEELFNLRFQHAIGQLGNTSRIKEVRRQIARVLTVIQEKKDAAKRAEVRG